MLEGILVCVASCAVGVCMLWIGWNTARVERVFGKGMRASYEFAKQIKSLWGTYEQLRAITRWGTLVGGLLFVLVGAVGLVGSIAHAVGR